MFNTKMFMVLFLGAVPISPLLAAQVEARGNVTAAQTDKQILNGDELLVDLVDREGQKSILALSVSAGKVQKLIVVSKGGQQSSWSPDKKKLSFSVNKSLYITDATLLKREVCPLDIVSQNDTAPACYWDNAGRAFIIGNNTAYGSYMARSISLRENLPLSAIKSLRTQIAAFPEIVLPLPTILGGKSDEGNPLSIVAASFSISSVVALQLFPSSPGDLLIGNSRVYLAKAPKTVSEKERLALQNGQSKIFSTSVPINPNIFGPFVEVAPNYGGIKTHPMFSPNGNLLSIEITDPSRSIQYPVVVDAKTLLVAQPKKEAEEGKNYFLPSWNGRNVHVINWIDNDSLLCMAGSYQNILIHKRTATGWIEEPVLSRVGSSGVRFDKVTNSGHLIAYTQTYDDQPSIHFFDLNSKQEFFWSAPQGSSISRMSW